MVTDVVNYKHELVTNYCKTPRQASYFKTLLFVFIIANPPFPLQLFNTKHDCKVVPVQQFGGRKKRQESFQKL